MEASLGRQREELKAGQERADQWAEGGSASVGRWRELLHSPWGLEGREVGEKNCIKWFPCNSVFCRIQATFRPQDTET